MSLVLPGATSGSITIDAPAVAGTNTLTLPTNSGTLLSDKTAGAVVQVVQGIKTDTFSTSAGMGSPVEITGLSASLTPKSTSNKILVTVVIGEIGASGGSTYNLILYRGSTAICLGDAAGNRMRSSSGGGIDSTGITWVGQSATIVFLDSPATTSSTTYTVRIGGNTTSVMTVNYDYRNSDVANDSSRVPSTIILQEVVA